MISSPQRNQPPLGKNNRTQTNTNKQKDPHLQSPNSPTPHPSQPHGVPDWLTHYQQRGSRHTFGVVAQIKKAPLKRWKCRKSGARQRKPLQTGGGTAFRGFPPRLRERLAPGQQSLEGGDIESFWGQTAAAGKWRGGKKTSKSGRQRWRKQRKDFQENNDFTSGCSDRARVRGRTDYHTQPWLCFPEAGQIGGDI